MQWESSNERVEMSHDSPYTTTKGVHVRQVISLDFEWIH
jgi:hypothetical protein